MKTSGQLQKKATAQSAPIPVSTNLFHRPFSKPSATAEAASTDTPDFQARLDFARIHAPNLNSLAANSSGDRAPSTVQPKLTVGAPNDQYEQEADRVADQVMGMPDSATQQPIQREAMPEEEEVRTKPLAASITPLVQREAMPEEEEIRTKPIATLQREEIPEEEESVSLQRSPDGNLQAGEGIESRLNQSKGGGSPLSDEVRSFMEPRFGADFSQVRVHTGSESVQMNQELNAQAFAHKQDVYFGAGKAPAKDALMAHELTHVVQQAETIQPQSLAASPAIVQRDSYIQAQSTGIKTAYRVPLIAQPNETSCWTAAMAMIVSYKKRATVTPRQIAKRVGISLDSSYGWDVLYAAADAYGLQALPSVSLDAMGWNGLLQKYGPLWVTESGNPSHSVALVGMHGDGSSEGTEVTVNDPWPPGAQHRTFMDFSSSFGGAAEAVGDNVQILY